MEYPPKDQNSNTVSDAAREEGANVKGLTRSEIEQQIKDAEVSQRIETHLLLVDNCLSSNRFDEAGKSIEQAKQNLAALPDNFEQKSRFAEDIKNRGQRLAELSAELVTNADIDAVIAHLNRSDLRDVGEKIEMKLKDVEQRELDITNQNKRLNRKLNGQIFLFILLVVLLAVLLSGAYFLKDALLVSNYTSVTPEVSREEFEDLQVSIESMAANIPTIPPWPTAVDLTTFENQLDEIATALTPVPTPVMTITVTPTPTVYLPGLVVSAQITPTIKTVNEAGEFVLTNLEYWFDIPDFEIGLATDNDFLFQLDEDETRYEVVNSKNDNLGALYAQVWQGTDLIYESIYPFVEDAFSEDNPKRLQINWVNTTFPIFPPGQYEIRLVTKRVLAQEPIAIIGEVHIFVIDSSIEVEVYDPTNSTPPPPTRLRTYPLWNCAQTCAKEALATSVQVLGYAIVPYELGEPGLPYRLPVTNTLGFTPVISFTNQLTITKLDSNQNPIVINLGESLSSDNVNNYADVDGILYVVSNADAKFFLVRIPDTREFYWLGEIDMLQFYDPDVRKDLLALPVFTVTEAEE